VECEICGSEIKTGVMKKIKGTYIKGGKKLHAVCSNCQKQGEEAIKDKLGKRI
jgi:ribosome-binding protein aMBF1 (putative translation factor)